MDEIDRIQELEEAKLAERISRIQRQLATQPRILDCVACGDEIPEERRAALPHATRCFECQSSIEKNSRFR